MEALSMKKCTREQRKLVANIEYALILLEKRKEFNLSSEKIKKLAADILYRINIQGLRVGNTVYSRKVNIIKNGEIWDLENVRNFLSNFK